MCVCVFSLHFTFCFFIHHCFRFAFMFSISHSSLVFFFFLNSSCSYKRLHFLSLPWELVACHSLKSYESKYNCVCVCVGWVLRFSFSGSDNSFLSHILGVQHTKVRFSAVQFFSFFFRRLWLDLFHVSAPKWTVQTADIWAPVWSFVHSHVTSIVITTVGNLNIKNSSSQNRNPKLDFTQIVLS